MMGFHPLLKKSLVIRYAPLAAISVFLSLAPNLPLWLAPGLMDFIRPAVAQASVTLTVDASVTRHTIPDTIYGMNFADPSLAAELRLGINRWGGNATTRYSYLADTSNRASDWFFENIPDDNSNPGILPAGSSADRFVADNRGAGTPSLLTLPLIGWTPKSRGYHCGFSVAKYGAQQQVDPWRTDCGNGLWPDGSPVSGNDPLDTSMAAGPIFVAGWVGHLVATHGAAGSGGVAFYNLDNEPMLWPHTHRDVHPGATSYDEMRDRTWQYAAAIKSADPTAKTLGPVLWGWTAYFYSALDQAPGGAWWNNPLDRNAHGGVPFVSWYLQQMQAYEQQHGVRLVDYLDLHYYPQASGVALSPVGNAATQALRLRSTRGLWDPGYVDESWIGEAVRLIPRMKDWVAENYPGTGLAITEYNWGALDHINGALAQADVLGIFGEQGLDLATLWSPPQADEPGAFAFRIYRNYDGQGGRFGEGSLTTGSTDRERLAVYATRRGTDGALTIMAINKDGVASEGVLTLSGFAPAGAARVYRYSGANTGAIVRQPDQTAGPTGFAAVLPAQSITLFVLFPSWSGDLDHSGGVDLRDVMLSLQVLAGLESAQPVHADADVDANGRLGLAEAVYGLQKTAGLR